MASPAAYSSQFSNRIQEALRRRIIGQGRLIERLLVALISNGHVLLEGVPGLAKTRLLSSLADCLDAKMNRIQFTPDLLPGDVIGTEIFHPQSGEFRTRQGPIFTNVLLADEINRAPAKVQSALLQAMEEREVTIGEETFSLPDPFLVLATQNPIEQEGTYPLPEAQIDRFMMKLLVTYPSPEEEFQILQLKSAPEVQLEPISNTGDLRTVRLEAANVFVDEKVDRFIVEVVQATRSPESFGLKEIVEWGASPRASIALKAGAKSLAYLRGEDFVSPELVQDLAADVLRHRIVLSFEAEAREISADEVIDSLVSQVPKP